MKEFGPIVIIIAAGLLGNPLLWLYRVHMDFRAGRLIMERYPRSFREKDFLKNS